MANVFSLGGKLLYTEMGRSRDKIKNSLTFGPDLMRDDLWFSLLLPISEDAQVYQQEQAWSRDDNRFNCLLYLE